jgi:hypothetical protein
VSFPYRLKVDYSVGFFEIRLNFFQLGEVKTHQKTFAY